MTMADFPEPASLSRSKDAQKSSHSFPGSSSTSTYVSAGNPLVINTHNIRRPHHQQSPSSEIIAPTPRRHLLESNASHSWLHTPPLSPVSSRGISPTSTRATSPHSHLTRGTNGQQSFGSIMELGAPKLTIVKVAHTSESGMGRRWIRWSHKRGMRSSLIALIFLACVFLKLSLGLGSYSGENTPPMYGDYEAQRHWMEITIHIPIHQWYKYDLQYWGLDYPPLTAYVSWICGIAAHSINPTWVALDSSRGIETASSKLFMRVSVVVFDALICVPALLLFSRTWFSTRSQRTQDLAFLLLMLHPALLLVDFGHFQYNSIMLGLTIMAMNFFATGQDLLGAVSFVLSLGFKQMALYYAPAIGSYLVAKCVLLGPANGGRLFVHLALTTVATFMLLFLPWIPPFSASPLLILDPIYRIFPFARGLFEDKVANFWCASNVVMKWKKWADQEILVKAAAVLTLLGFLPSVIVVGKAAWDLKVWNEPAATKVVESNGESEPEESSSHTQILPLLPYALLNSSMSFFLFSFQVHEKTILLPLMPLMLLFSGATSDSEVYSWGALGSNVAVFSMWPLLKKDGLALSYFSLTLLWNRLIGHDPIKLIYTAFPFNSYVHLFSAGVYAAVISLHLLELIVAPPARYPDLFPVLNVLISTPVFVCLWLWSIKCCVQVSWAITGPLAFGEAENEHSKRSSTTLSDVNERRFSFATKSDRTRAASLGHARGKRVRRSSTHSATGSATSTAIPPSSSVFRGNAGSNFVEERVRAYPE
ncbi:glycosyltransferase family 57 protein [Lentinula novae-zelandiae]|nr:glycosyltransferase family 57 protein [Lentinula novae-zelandiae]